MVSAFLSYAGPDRIRALWLASELKKRDVQVVMDINFRPGESIVINISRGLSGSDVVVALITSDYISRHFTEMELSLVLATPTGKFIPIILGDPPTPSDERSSALWKLIESRTYFRLEESTTSLDTLVEHIESIAQAEPGKAVNATFPVPRQVALWYDWEDGRLEEDAIASLSSAGTSIALTVSGASRPTTEILASSEALAIIWTQAAKSSSECAQLLLDATVKQRQIIYLMGPDSPAPPPGADVQPLRETEPRVPRPRRGRTPSTTQPEDRRLLARALAANGGIPFHVLGDKFCVSRDTAASVAEAYERAISGLPPNHETLLAAELAHTAVLRFRGNWKAALEILGDDPRPSLAVEVERLSLRFESGHVSRTADDAALILSRALSASEWDVVISAHRLLGMYYEESGDYQSARDHLQSAVHYAGDLFDARPLTDRLPSRSARLALKADCLREVAALEWRAGDAMLAAAYLEKALCPLDEIATEPVAQYLSSVIKYQTARVHYTIAHDYEEAKGLLTAGYQTLQQFENPLRMATVLESVARLEMDFLRHRDNDVVRLRPTLEKILRVRNLREHNFMIARTIEAFGDLDFALGNWSDALDRYEDAAIRFSSLHKTPEWVGAKRSVSRCLTRLGEADEAKAMLTELIEGLADPRHDEKRAELRSELARLRRLPLDGSGINDDTDMMGVGEFGVHSWIARTVGVVNSDSVVVGIGDDAAVVGVNHDDDLVVSTDSVPTALLSSNDVVGAAHAGRVAVISGIADVLAMGGEPVALLFNLHVPRRKPITWTTAFYQAANDEAAKHGASIVGGDLKERSTEALAVTAVGRVRKGRSLRRSGARVGEHLILTLSGGPRRLGARWARELIAHLSGPEKDILRDLAAEPERLSLPDDIMRLIVAGDLAASAMDTSDGILACAQLIGEASDVGFELFPDVLEAQLHPDVHRLAEALGIAPFLFALNGGNDWEVVLTAAKADGAIAEALRVHDRPDDPCVAIIGRVVKHSAWSNDAVIVRGAETPLKYFTDEKFVLHPFELRAREWLDYAREATRSLGRTVVRIED